jgi:hypothetical protein
MSGVDFSSLSPRENNFSKFMAKGVKTSANYCIISHMYIDMCKIQSKEFHSAL